MDSIVIIAGIILLASSLHRLFGFGFASIALPLIAILTNFEAGVLLMLCLSGFIALQNVLQHWKFVDHRAASTFAAISVVGVLLGYLVVDDVSTRTAGILASSFILATALISLSTQGKSKNPTRLPLAPLAVAAGLSNVVSSVNGPLIGLFFGQSKQKKEAYIGTVSMVFLLVNLMAIGAQLAADAKLGLSPGNLAIVFAALMIGSFVGRLVFTILKPQVFKQYLLYAIIGLTTLSLVRELTTL